MIAEEVRSHGVIDGVAVSSGEMVVLQGTEIAPAPAEDRSKIFHLAGQGEDVPGWRMRYFCPADFNRDDQIDEEDARAFVNEWMDRSGELAPYLDIDMDGLLTERDLDLFFSAFNGTCDPSEQAHMRAIIC